MRTGPVRGDELFGTLYEKGTVVFREGDPGNVLYVIQSGAVEVTREREGRTTVVALLERGDFFGEMALVDDHRRSATITTIARTRLLPITRESFQERVAADPGVAVFLIRTLSLRIERMRASEGFEARGSSDGSAGDPFGKDPLSDALPSDLLARIRKEPEVALRAIQVLVLRLRAMLGAANRAGKAWKSRRTWPALIGAGRPLRAAIVSLSSCGGCAAALLEDSAAFLGGFGGLEVVYCPMLMDASSFPVVDLTIVDGAVRGREDVERLEEARAKSRFLIGFGTCAATGGVPAAANRSEIEEVVAESFGRTQDAFGHYFAGTRLVEGPSFLVEQLALLRRVSGIGDVVKVEGHIPGCPPPLDPLVQAVAELSGRQADSSAGGRERRPVCSECPRSARKDTVESFRNFPGKETGPTDCLATRGVLCLGFMTRSGCGAPCTQGGMPCWGCRGATDGVTRKIAEGESVEGLSLDGLARFSKLDVARIRPSLARARTAGLSAIGLAQPIPGGRTRVR